MENVITKEKFESYLSVQKSGVTNMFDAKMVSELSGLNKNEIFDIMENYGKYNEEFGFAN